MHFRQINAIRVRQKNLRDFSPTDDRNFIGSRSMAFLIRERERLLCIVYHNDSFGLEVWIYGHDNVRSSQQRPTNRLKGFSSHDYRLAERFGFEVLKARRDMPWQLAVYANDAVVSAGNDEGHARRLFSKGYGARAHVIGGHRIGVVCAYIRRNWGVI